MKNIAFNNGTGSPHHYATQGQQHVNAALRKIIYLFLAGLLNFATACHAAKPSIPAPATHSYASEQSVVEPPPRPSSDSKPTLYSFSYVGEQAPIEQKMLKKDEAGDIDYEQLIPPSMLFYKTEITAPKETGSNPAGKSETPGEWDSIGLSFRNPTNWITSAAGYRQMNLYVQKGSKTGTPSYKGFLAAKMPPNSQGAVFYIINSTNSPKWEHPKCVTVPLDSFMNEKDGKAKDVVLVVNGLAEPLCVTLAETKVKIEARSFVAIPLDPKLKTLKFRFQILRGNTLTDIANGSCSRYPDCIMNFCAYANPHEKKSDGSIRMNVSFGALLVPKLPNVPESVKPSTR